MEIFGVLISFLAILAVGWNVLFWIIKRDRSFSIYERSALSFIIGLGVITLHMFLYSVFGLKFTITNVLTPHLFLGFLTCVAFVRTKDTGKEEARGKTSLLDILLLFGISFQVIHAFFKALVKPMDSFDSIGNFAFKSKMFFFERYVPYELFLDKSIDIQHPDYPLFIPLSETWLYMFMRTWNDLLVKALFPVFMICLLVILYSVLKRVMGHRLALVSAFMLATIPHFLNYATIGYADFGLTMFYAASFMYIFLWISHKRDNRYMCLATVLAVMAVWAKHEGVFFLLINLAILALFSILNRRTLRRAEIAPMVIFALVTTVFTAAWFVYFHKLGFSNEFVNKETLRISVFLRNLNRMPLILYEYQKHVFGPKKWNLSYLLLVAGLLFYWKKAFRGDFKYITSSILLAFSGYGFFYLITPLEIKFHLQTAGSRLLIHFLPLTIFWLSFLAREILDGESDIHR